MAGIRLPSPENPSTSTRRRRHPPLPGIPAFESVGAVIDANGQVGRPLGRAYDTLGALLKAGTLTVPQVNAGHQIHRYWRSAHKGDLSALDLRRPRGPGGKPSHVLPMSVEAAKRRVYDAIEAMDGYGSHEARAVMHIVCEDETINCLHERSEVHRKALTEYLQDGLSKLAKYYGMT